MATLVACSGGGSAPEFDDPGKQIAQVGTQLSLTLIATDEDGDDLDFDFSATIPDIQSRAQLTRSPSGAAIFRWTPQAGDVGDWFVDFVASDGSNDTVLTVEIDVRSAIGGAGAPVFREPLGTGTTLDLETATCLDVAIVIEDQDSTSVTIAMEQPTIEDAELSGGGLTGTWHWCPTMAQIDAQDRYTLTLSADDGTNPKTLKDYLIVLRKPDRPDCPGEPPVITHAPADISTLNDLTVDASITDDEGLKQPPIFYYSTTNPGANPDLGAMTQTTMILLDGTTWGADVPNPVVGETTGTMTELYYVIIADDDDDDMGDCDHTTESAVFSMTVTNPGGTGTTALCDGCSNDIQCGGGGDLCVRVGAMAEAYCLQTCTSNAQCPSGYTCPTATVTSVNGATGRQCQPTSGSCEAGTTCVDDLYEDNDNRTQAGFQPYLAADLYDLTSCPMPTGTDDDEDFFEITLADESQVTLEISGEDTTDLDLALQTSTGTLLQSSTSLTSDETITRCVPAGSYFVRVYAYGTGANDYLLSYETGACSTACVEDPDENDDTLATARDATGLTYSDASNTICSDDDWYEVLLFTGEQITVDLTFTHSSQGDLDLHFHNSTGTDLTPCSEASPGTCTAAQGQGASSNEHYEFTAPATGCSGGCTYYVKVHGWSGSKNSYGIGIGVE